MSRRAPSRPRAGFRTAATQVACGALGGVMGFVFGALAGPVGAVCGALGGALLPGAVMLYRAEAGRERGERLVHEPVKVARVTYSFSAVWAEAEDRLTKARYRIGRASPMHKTLDKLVKAVRRLERRLVEEDEYWRTLEKGLRRRVPLIAEMAERYVDLAQAKGDDRRMRAAEGILRRAAEALGRLAAASPGRSDLVWLEVETELLGDGLGEDVEALADEAAALHGAHHLRALAGDMDAEGEALANRLAAGLEAFAARVGRDAHPPEAAHRFARETLPPILEAADLHMDLLTILDDPDHEALAKGHATLRYGLAALEEVSAALDADAVAEVQAALDRTAAALRVP